MKRIILLVLVVALTATVEVVGGTPHIFNRYALTKADQAALKQMGIRTMRSQFLMEMGYTADVLKAFEPVAGVKVAEAILNPPYSIEMQTLLSDVVVHGKVASIDSLLAPPYHSVVYIQVDEYLRNDYHLPLGKIPVLLISGPEGRYQVRASGEVTFTPGDEVYLFLTASSLYLELQLNNLAGLKVLESKPDLYFRVTEMAGVYQPGGGELHSKTGTTVSVTDWRDKVTKTVKVLGR